MTIKQRKFIKELISCQEPTEAAFRVYNCKDRNSAKVIASQNLTKLNISSAELMEKMGISDEEDTKDLKRLRKAKYLHHFSEMDDNATQLKALELTYKLKGKLKDKGASVDNSQHFTIIQYGKEEEQNPASTRSRVQLKDTQMAT